MNISIKNIQNCNKLDENKLKNLITKLKLKPNENYENYENYQDYNDPDNKIKICNLINKKVKEFYDSLTTYHETRERNMEVYVPLVFAELVPVAEEIHHDANPFIDFQLEEGDVVEE